ncbi:hypothetical protein A7A09_017205 [Paracoccus methylarcula]|uniref:Uncharacterized protein n=1 Tax=Paracoccus methylarcula TaxID=72022 RepID=A0A422QTU0_9RHOB|nr:hypothetical protein A7A09_017205 [Paracoccus methylarcula]
MLIGCFDEIEIIWPFAMETRKPDVTPDWVVEKQTRAQALADGLIFERKEGEPLPPWIEKPRILLGSIGWRMGAGETYLHEVFFPFWQSLTEREQDGYWKKFDLGPRWEDRSRWMNALDFNRAKN